jgi:hypothetical protein
LGVRADVDAALVLDAPFRAAVAAERKAAGRAAGVYPGGPIRGLKAAPDEAAAGAGPILAAPDLVLVLGALVMDVLDFFVLFDAADDVIWPI